MAPSLDTLAWLAAGAIVLGVVVMVVVRVYAFRIARGVVRAAERGVAATITPGLRASRRHDAARGRGGLDAATEQRYVAQIDTLARLMDRLVPLPIVGGVGLDFVFGLFPVAGDVASMLVSSVVIIRAAQLGAPPELLSRLLAMQVVDVALGAVPAVGDLLDIGYQADRRSAALIREWMRTRS
jgi:hypothetical protein